jgi:hypothetical protein
MEAFETVACYRQRVVTARITPSASRQARRLATQCSAGDRRGQFKYSKFTISAVTS